LLEIAEFRQAYESSNWIFDLFACGYDFLDGRYDPDALEAFSDQYELQRQKVIDLELVEEIARADGRIPDVLSDYLSFPAGDDTCLEKEFLTRLYCVLRAIDMASEGINYLGGHTSVSPGRWFRVYQDLFVQNGELTRNANGVVALRPKALVPPKVDSWWNKAVDKGEWEHFLERGMHFHRHFDNLIRSYDIHGCRVERKFLSPIEDIGRVDWGTLKIGVVPLIESLSKDGAKVVLQPGPLRILQEPSPEPRFTIEVEDGGDPAHCCDELCLHAELALRAFAKREVQIAVFPEMVVPDPVLAHVKAILARLRAEGNKYPALVLAGSFARPILKNDDNKPYNVAVLLNGDGTEICSQKKMHPYDMHDYERDRFGITELFTGSFSREDIAVMPRQMVFVDSPSSCTRIAILICEDSAHAKPGLRTVTELRANLVFIPVMAGALLSGRGFGKTVQQLTGDPGGLIVVANSAALAREQWAHISGPDREVPEPPLGIVGLPLANLSFNRLPLELLFTASRTEVGSGPEVLIFQSPRA
jgi:hypothetical protein